MPPTIVELTKLPPKLLVQITNPLDDESICALAKTCRTLHFVALPLFLSRYGVCILPPNCVSITCPSKEALSVLQASLFMEHIKKIPLMTMPTSSLRIAEVVCAFAFVCLPLLDLLDTWLH